MTIHSAWARIPPPVPESFQGTITLSDSGITLVNATIFSDVQTVLYSTQIDAIPLTVTPVQGGYTFVNTSPFSLPGVALPETQALIIAAQYTDGGGDHLAISLAGSVSPTLSFDEQFPLVGGEATFLSDLATKMVHTSAVNFMSNYPTQLIDIGQGHTEAPLFGFSGPSILGSSTVTLVPEPASAVLFTVGAAGISAVIRRRRSTGPAGVQIAFAV